MNVRGYPCVVAKRLSLFLSQTKPNIVAISTVCHRKWSVSVSHELWFVKWHGNTLLGVLRRGRVRERGEREGERERETSEQECAQVERGRKGGEQANIHFAKQVLILSVWNVCRPIGVVLLKRWRR